MSLPLEASVVQSFLELEVAGFLRRLQGRETFLHRAPDGRAIVVKRSGSGVRPDGRREFEALNRLAREGIPVPVALGFARGPRGSVVVMERVPHVETARDRLDGTHAAERRALLDRVAEILARLHAAGLCHRDFYAQHLLLRSETDELVLIDVGRAGRAPAPARRWFVKDVGAFLHSLPARVTPRERMRFLARYLDSRGLESRRARRSFVRDAFAKARRIGRHVPRDERVSTEQR